MPMKELEIDLVPEFVRPSFRTKHVCLTMEDWGRIGDDLVKQFPKIRFVRGISDAEWRGEAQPDIRIEENLRAVLLSVRESRVFRAFFEPNLQLGLRRELYESTNGESYMVWRSNPSGLPRIRVRTSAGPDMGWDGKGPEQLRNDKIEFACEPGNKNHLALAQQFFGILRRQISKEPLVSVGPGYEVQPTSRTAALEWIGKDAMRWAREDTKRLLRSSQSHGDWGFRPVD